MSFKKLTMMYAAIFGVLAMSAPHAAIAQNPSVPLKIVTVDIAAVRAKATATKSINEQLLKIKNQFTTQLQAEEKALREANGELARKRTLLAPDAFAAERKKYEQRFVAFQTKRQDSQKVMNQKVAEANNQLSSKMVEIIGAYAQANQVSLVLPSNVTIFAADAYNISGQILKTLNKEMPSVVIALPTK